MVTCPHHSPLGRMHWATKKTMGVWWVSMFTPKARRKKGRTTSCTDRKTKKRCLKIWKLKITIVGRKKCPSPSRRLTVYYCCASKLPADRPNTIFTWSMVMKTECREIKRLTESRPMIQMLFAADDFRTISNKPGPDSASAEESCVCTGPYFACCSTAQKKIPSQKAY